jgi:DNA-binding NtrC family response regulator
MAATARTVLVVDDDDSIRMLCRVNLELEGYRVLEAETVESAISQLGGGAIDVVLLDVHVGSGDGFGVLDHVGAERVALFTGSLEVEPAHRERVDAVLTKPFTLDQLSSTVADLAAGS